VPVSRSIEIPAGEVLLPRRFSAAIGHAILIICHLSFARAACTYSVYRHFVIQ
jgi:hypothetical protein